MSLPDGWLTEEEAGELRRLAKGKTVLELGAWKGRSTVVLAEVAYFVISVDRHLGIPDHGDSLLEYVANVRGCGNVAIVISDFASFVPVLEILDMVYVDGDHDADSVERDTQLALDAKPYLVAFHDWDIEGVREGVKRVLEREPDALVGSVASFLL